MRSTLWMSFLQLCSLTVQSSNHEIYLVKQQHSIRIRPSSIMTDVINKLGIKIMQQYMNNGNVAYSPIGAAFVLIAVYEGSSGKGSQQIYDTLYLPCDQEIMRIGLRDILRSLRTYLEPENFLDGLKLNGANVEMRSDYQDILRYYGFNLTSVSQLFNTTPLTNATTFDGLSNDTNTENTTVPVTTTDLGLTTMMNETTNSTTVMSVMVATNQTANDSTISSTTITSITPDSTPMTTNISNVTDAMTTINTSVDLLPVVQNNTTNPLTLQNNQLPATNNMSTEQIMASLIEKREDVSEARERDLSPLASLSYSSHKLSSNQIMSEELVNTPPSAFHGLSLMKVAIFKEMSTPEQNNSLEWNNIERHLIEKSILDSSQETYPNSGTNILRQQTVDTVAINNLSRPIRSALGLLTSYYGNMLRIHNRTFGRRSVRQNGIPQKSSTELPFLVNGCDLTTVPAASYTAILPFAYFSFLKAVGLELPLDNPKYNILLLLSTEAPDTTRLIKKLSLSNLRLLRKHMYPTWIKATIPSFMVKGYVSLTRKLEMLGITDVFNPRAADLSPMTSDLGAYVRDIEQNVGVSIQNNMNSENVVSQILQSELTSSIQIQPNAYHIEHEGKQLLKEDITIQLFLADHPFLYFVIDSETSAALIAGRIDDPVNSRII